MYIYISISVKIHESIHIRFVYTFHFFVFYISVKKTPNKQLIQGKEKMKVYNKKDT